MKDIIISIRGGYNVFPADGRSEISCRMADEDIIEAVINLVSAMGDGDPHKFKDLRRAAADAYDMIHRSGKE